MSNVRDVDSLVVAPWQRVAGGFKRLDGPAWHAPTNKLMINDVWADIAYAWSDADGLEVLRHPSGKASGQVVDHLGRLIVCEHLTSSLVLVSGLGERDVLASHFDGRQLNSPTDVVIAPDGSVLFTDPTAGRRDSHSGAARPMQLGFCGVYQWRRTGEISLLSSRLAEPTALCLSIDQARLYVNDAATGEVVEFKTSWGSKGMVLDEGRVFARLTEPCCRSGGGMEVDARGNVWMTDQDCLRVFDSTGRLIESILVPEPATNLTWGGLDGLDLYVTATTSIFRTRTAVAGAAWI